MNRRRLYNGTEIVFCAVFAFSRTGVNESEQLYAVTAGISVY